MEPITPERWQQVKQIFQAALERAPAERATWLSEACAHDLSLRPEVESLLAAHESSGGFLDEPAFDLAADSGHFLVGKTLGRYQILALLGRGGMGEVYRAKDTMLGREVAIKVLLSAVAEDRNRLLRFEQEARAASALNHPNILTIHEFGQLEGWHFIVSELIEGETLRQRLTRERLRPAALLDIALQITNALEAAHEAGIVHRDLKPENVMLRPDGIVKVVDFGLAKLAELRNAEYGMRNEETVTLLLEPQANPPSAIRHPRLTTPGLVMGTVNYMSPEQVRGQELDARSDLFSLGVVLYEMVAGHTPFANATQADVIAAILEKEPPPLVSTQLPEPLTWIVAKALRKDRADRYQTARDLRNDLKSLKSGEAAITSSISRTIALRDRLQRRWRSVALVVLGLLVVSLGALYYSLNDKAMESVAVLPFTFVDGETEYLADGITEVLINDLARLSHLKVRPRNAVFQYKKRDVDAPTAGRELVVEAVLTGQITRRGEEILVSLQLIDVRENRQLWGNKYTARAGDLLATQTRMIRDVTENLRLRLSTDEQQLLAKRPTDNAAANDLYLKGRLWWNQRTREGYRNALGYYEQAIQLDPAFALAYAGLADCYVLGGNYQLPTHEVMARARNAALQALQLDATLGEAHAARAQVEMSFDWNFAAAEASYQRAIALKPEYETAHHWYALLLALMGRFPEAIERIKVAQQLNPISPIIYKDAGMIYYYAGQYEAAIAACRQALDLAPELYSAYSVLGDIYLRQGRGAEALAALRRADELAKGASITKVARGAAQAVLGQQTEALTVLREVRQGTPQRPVSPFYLAMLHASLGQNDAALKQLEQAYQERAYRMVYLKVDPMFASLRADPRFQDLLRRVGFSP
jgi:serine/threonine protein kinase/TolB-like protein/Flp pilus assembly protein TadD